MQIKRSNENDLIRQTLAGDTSAFDLLVKIYRTTIYMLVLSYIKNPADAEDLTQRIFIRAYERLATLRDPNCFLPWLQRIAQNTCKNWLRRQGDSTTDFEPLNGTDFAGTAPSPEEVALKAEIETIVREAIGALTETDRKLMEARYIEGASYDQLQVESGLSYAAIANRLKRAKQQIRRRIEKLLGGMVILPGRTLIFGGIEIVKVSTKTKLAAVGVAAVLGIGGGSLVYHHSYESNPVSEYRSVVVNAQEGQEARAVPGDSSTTAAHRTDATVKSNAPTDGAKDETNRLEPTAGREMKDANFTVTLPNEGVTVDNVVTVTGDLKSGDVQLISSDGKVLPAVKAVVGVEWTEAMFEKVPEHIRQAIAEQLENSDRHSLTFSLVAPEGVSVELREKIESGQVKMSFADQYTLSFADQSTSADTPSDSTELTPQPTDSVLSPSDPTVASTTTPTEPSESTPQLSDEDWAEFEKLVSDFSDEDWAEFERLLRASIEAEPPQQNKQPSVAPKGQRRQRVIEKVNGKTPITPSVLQELQKQRRILPQRDANTPPRPKKNAARNRD